MLTRENIKKQINAVSQNLNDTATVIHVTQNVLSSTQNTVITIYSHNKTKNIFNTFLSAYSQQCH